MSKFSQYPEITSIKSTDYLLVDVFPITANSTSKISFGNMSGQTGTIPVFNVKSAPYNAKGDGNTDDSGAIQAAINACDAAGGGTVYFPIGNYRVANHVQTPNSGNIINLIGAGIDGTTIRAKGAIDAVVTQQTNGLMSDMTVDGNRESYYGLLGILPVGGVSLRRMDFVRVRARNTKPSGFWTFAVWDQNETFQIQELHCTDMMIEGPANAAGDGFAVTSVDTAYFSNVTIRDLERSPNFYLIRQLIVDGLYVKNVPNYGGFVIDGVTSAMLSNVYTDADSAQAVFDGQFIEVIGGEFNSGIQINTPGSGNNPAVTLTGTRLRTITINGNVPSKLLMDNCTVTTTPTVGAAIWDVTAGGGTLNYLEVNNSFFDCSSTVGSRWIGSANGTTWDKSKLNNNTVINGNGIYNITLGPQFQAKNNLGLNPDILYAVGNVTGNTTIDRTNGDYQTMTQTGNVTFIFNSGKFKDDELTLDVTTAAHTQTWPGNVKLAGGAYAMTGRSLLTLKWDGTNWIETNRSANVS
jgi:hypothetical protein